MILDELVKIKRNKHVPGNHPQYLWRFVGRGRHGHASGHTKPDTNTFHITSGQAKIFNMIE